MKKYFLSITLFLLIDHCFGQDSWQQVASFPNVSYSGPNNFVINNKIYCVGGEANGNYHQVWEYDPKINVWTQKTDCPVTSDFAVSFSIGNKGYYGMGFPGLSLNLTNKFYEYDPVADTWTRKADYPLAVGGSVGFSILNKGYVCSGMYDPNTGEPTTYFAEYDPQTNSWTQKASYPDAMTSGSAFVINNKGYVGMGNYGPEVRNYLFEYDPSSNTWTQKTSLNSDEPNAGGGRTDAISFAIGNGGYVGFGGTTDGHKFSDFWRYNVLTDSWTKITSSISSRKDAIGCSVNGLGYIGLGTSGSDELWRFIPACSADLVLNETVPKDRTYQSSNTITTIDNFNVLNGDSIILSAGVSVSFKDGFHASSGSLLNAKIQPCPVGSYRLATDNEADKTIIQKTNLFENSSCLIAYPSPARGETTIVYKVEKRGSVKLYITDNLGRITSLVNDNSVEPGEYKTTFNSKELSDGLYIYTLVTNSRKEMKRLTVINQQN